MKRFQKIIISVICLILAAAMIFAIVYSLVR